MTSPSEPVQSRADRRKLVAVVHADIVGYSRLIGQDDTGTLERVRELRRNLIDPAVAEHGGRIVNTAGDALLVVFDSAEGAVRCAVEVQQQVPADEADQSPDRRISFRIGINVGDVIPDGNDLHGDVVNVAARLQAECPPGGVCVSRGVREHVGGRLDLAFEALGPLNLKNITQSVEAFVLRPGAADKSVERTLVHGTGEALPLPDKPSIAVLAFTNMSGDADQEYFSDGIADDIITELSRSRSLFVIARNSSFTYKGCAVDVRQVARELGVRYVLEGSVRRSSDRVRVAAQFIDAETGNHIWAERYDRALEDVFAVQDEITAAVVTAIIPAVGEAELRRMLRKPPETLGAWEAYQRGLWHLGKTNSNDAIKAQLWFERATALDAGFAAAHVGLSRVFAFHAIVTGVLSFDEGMRLSGEQAREAVALDPNDPEGQALLASWRASQGRGEQALAALSLTVARNPNSAWAIGIKGVILVSLGRRSDGRAAIQTAMRLDPHHVNAATFLNWIAISHYHDGDYASAVAMVHTVIERYPGFTSIQRWMAAALGQLGRLDEAREWLQRAIEASPRSFNVNVPSRPAWSRPEDYEHMLDGLRKAGWQG